MKNYFIILFILSSLALSCRNETDNKIYSLALLFPTNFNAEAAKDNRMNYESIHVCYSFMELKNSELIIYKNKDNTRKSDTLELLVDEVQEFKEIVEDHLNKTFEGRFMDTVTQFKSRCCDGCTTFVAFIRDNNSRLEKINFSMNGLKREKNTVAFLKKIEDKSDYRKMSRKEFMESVLVAEQFANIQFPLPPQRPFIKPN